MVIRWGGTCGEGFSEPASKWHLDNRDNVEKIGREVSQKATSLIDCGNDKTQHQVEISVRAGGRDDGRVLTAKVVYDVRTQYNSSKREHVSVKKQNPPHE